MNTTAHATTDQDKAEEKRAYHRNYFRNNPEAARKNRERTYERNLMSQRESQKNARNKGATWKEEDMNELVELYPQYTQREIAYILGRTVRSVQKKAKELGLRKNVRHKE